MHHLFPDAASPRIISSRSHPHIPFVKFAPPAHYLHPLRSVRLHQKLIAQVPPPRISPHPKTRRICVASFSKSALDAAFPPEYSITPRSVVCVVPPGPSYPLREKSIHS